MDLLGLRIVIARPYGLLRRVCVDRFRIAHVLPRPAGNHTGTRATCLRKTTHNLTQEATIRPRERKQGTYSLKHGADNIYGRRVWCRATPLRVLLYRTTTKTVVLGRLV